MTNQDSWDAAAYDARFAFVSAGGAPILARLDPRPGQRILDLGCGTGELTAQIAATGADVVGLDADAAMVGRARQRFPDLRFVETAGEDPSWAAHGPLDAVFSNAALHWMQPGPVLANARAALRPGGRFVGEFGGQGNVASVRAALAEARAQAGLPARASPWYFPSIARHAQLLEGAGFEPRWLELVDRPTPLQEGIVDWLRMFGGRLLDDVPDAEALAQAVARKLEPRLRRDGVITLDYRRLRFEAIAL